MFTIQTLNKISKPGLKLFEQKTYKVVTKTDRPDAILLRSFKLDEEMILSSVKAVARAGVGVNNIPIDLCTDRGIVVFNTPGANANSVKELVLAGLFLSSRRIHEGLSWVENQQYKENMTARVEKEKSLFAGNEISGKRLGVIGLGAVGVLVANAAVDLGMDVLGYDPFISVAAAWGLSREVLRCDNLDRLLAACDYITLHVPLNEETENMINTARLKHAKKGLKVLNFSRDALVDPAAIKTAFSDGTVNRYVTDFPTPALHGHRAVLAIPHLGASTAEAEDNCAAMAVRQLKDFLETGNIVNSVNFPACTLEVSEGARLLVANRNIPSMLNQILSVLAEANLNIEDMVNRHRDGIAYNIIRLSTSCLDKTLLERIGSIEGVVMIRQICP